MDRAATSVEQYKREVLCAALCFTQIRANPLSVVTPELRADILLAVEYTNDTHLAGRVPPQAEARPAMEEVAAEICECVRRRQWDALRPSEWGMRTFWRDYYARSWAGRARYTLWWYYARLLMRGRGA